MLLYYRDCLLLIFSDVVMYVYVYICICMYVKSLSKWRRDVCLKGFRLKLSPLTYRQRLKKITLLTDSDSFLFNVVLFYNFFCFLAKYTTTTMGTICSQCATHKKSFALRFIFFCIVVVGAFASCFSVCDLLHSLYFDVY